MRFNLPHPGVLDADLLLLQGDLPPESFEFSLLAKSWIETISGPAEGLGKGEIGQADGMHRGGPDAPGPALG